MSSSEARRSDKRRKARSKRKEAGETPAESSSSPLLDDERFDSNIDEGPKLDLDLEEAAADVMSEIVSNICASPGTFPPASFVDVYDPVPFAVRPAEQPDHERYMNEFRVCLCTAHADKTCPNDSYTCFDSHSKHTRRPPILISNDEYNYAPTRCRYVQTMHGKRRCPQGDACRYAHSTEEMIYHPLVYKTQLCPHTLSPNAVCTGFGQHCAKAHGPGELRYPAPCNSSTDRIFLARPSPTSFLVSLPTDIELGITRENPAFYMLCYKTDRCPHKSCPRTCERYHNLKERRRCPKFFFYSEQPCPFVKSGGATKNWRDPSRCPDGDACRYSHTLLEQMYHPNIYKTSLCNNYSEQDPSRCTWGPLCTHAHGVADMQRQGRGLAVFDRDLTKAASQAILRPAKATSPVVEALSDDSTRARPRFSLPPPLNGNQIWLPTTSDDQALFTRGIWNSPIVPSSSSSWKSELRVYNP